ncbi:MAG: flavin reductase family protein, partial [Planctomycetes bacterium]|nr:flavin reductase family protein [Planctomycetota bacterium]
MVDREVWIVTSSTEDGRRGGLLATWVAQASIDRDNPVLLAGIAPNHYTAELIDESRSLAAHLVSADQAALALSFAIGSGRDRDKLAGLEFRSAASGSPILAAAHLWGALAGGLW